MRWLQSIQRYHLLFSVDLKSNGLVVALHNLIQAVIRLQQGASYRIVTYKNVCAMREIFAYVGLVLGVIARWCCTQTFLGAFELCDVIPWISLVTAAAAVEEFSWQAQGGAIDQLRCGALEVFFQGSADAQQHKKQVFCPASVIGLCPERCLQLTVETFLYHTISDGMVGAGVNPLGPQQLHQLVPQVEIELSPLISRDRRWSAKTSNPPIDKRTGRCMSQQ